MSDPIKETPKTPVRSEHGVAYESQDLGATGIAKTVGVLFVVIFGVYFVCALLAYVFRQHIEPVTPGMPVAHHNLPPEPRLEVVGPANLIALHAEEDQLLNSYAWTDASHTAVRIPITRAIELIADRHLPSRAEKEKS